jgi:hypothetical protein
VPVAAISVPLSIETTTDVAFLEVPEIVKPFVVISSPLLGEVMVSTNAAGGGG